MGRIEETRARTQPGSKAAASGAGRPRDEERTRAILRAAYALLAADGPEGATSAGIAAAAGVSTATLYRRWASKEALLVDAVLAETDARIRRAHAQRSSTRAARVDPLGALRSQLLSSASAFSGAQGEVLSALLRFAHQAPDLREAILEGLLRPRRAADVELVRACQAAGSLDPDVDPDLLLDALYGPLYFRLWTGLAPVRRRDAARHFELVLRGAAP